MKTKSIKREQARRQRRADFLNKAEITTVENSTALTKAQAIAQVMGEADIVFCLGILPTGETRVTFDPRCDPQDILSRVGQFFHDTTSLLDGQDDDDQDDLDDEDGGVCEDCGTEPCTCSDRSPQGVH